MARPDPSILKEKLRRLPEGPGVYLMKDRFGSVLYVGKAVNLRRRVGSYFQGSRQLRISQPKVAAMLDLICDVEVITTANEAEALLLEGRLIKQFKPRHNTDFTDDKRFLLVRLEAGVPLPRFRLVRFRSDEQSRYFGPFAHSGAVRRTLAELRLKFGILLGDASPRRREDGTWQLYDDARAEIYGHANILTEAEYATRVEAACTFLEGRAREWLAELEMEMTRAAEAQEYERAAELRDRMLALKGALVKARTFARDPVNLLPRDAEGDLASLGTALGAPGSLHAIECFDISHISGTYCVASMVRFVAGRAERAGYRRFQIRSFVGNDDFRAMEEVVGRRYRRLQDEGKPFPELVVIDGGRGQVGAALRAFLGQGLEPPLLIGLAKREETIVFGDNRPDLNLPGHHRGRLLLQRIRDEAHRFANTYNADLRSRQLRATLLDDFPGLGPVRRARLLETFGTIEALAAADAARLAEVEGIGPKLAASLRQFLQERSPAARGPGAE